MTDTIARLKTAATHTYTDEAKLAIEDAVSELARLETEAATWRAQYECAWNLAVCEKYWRNELQGRLSEIAMANKLKQLKEDLNGPHEQG
jgi:hypothetical protein